MFNTVADRVIENTSFFLDGIRFVRCRFVNCELIFEGKDEVDFQDCTFERCSWTFDGAAERTIGFLSTLYKKNGPTGVELVEGIFESIRSERVADVRASVHADLQVDAVVARESA